MYLLDNYNYNDYIRHYASDASQIIRLINEGLLRCGYEFREKDGKLVTFKHDVSSEIIAVENKEYSEDIFDFLGAKGAKEKEEALTNLSIKLETIKTTSHYLKSNRKYLQIMRHKNEKQKDPCFAWFFEQNSYETNLNNLFLILVSYIARIKSDPALDKFNSNVIIIIQSFNLLWVVSGAFFSQVIYFKKVY